MHVDQQRAHPLVLWRFRIGADEELTILRSMSDGGPNLLPVDDERIAVEHRAALQGGKIGTSSRLRHAFAPDLIAGKNRLEVAFLLFVGAPLHDRRAGHNHAKNIASHGKAKASELLLKDHLLDECG